MSDLLTYELSDSIATIAMDDGKVNCLSPQMLAGIDAALDQAERDEAVVLLTGREGMFSGGFDLSVFKQGAAAIHQMLKAGAELAERIVSFPRPVVIACTGHSVAMGSFLLLSADQRIGAEGRFKIMLNEVAIGMTVPQFGVEIGRLRLTPSHYNRALVTAEPFLPEQAVEAGFLDRVVPAADVLKEARSVAMAATKLNMRAHAETKLRAREHVIKALRVAIETELGSEEAFVKHLGQGVVPGGG